MIRVYVAGRYSADNVLDVLKNIGRGQQACARLFSLGFSPFCPWADRSFVMDRPDDDFTVDQFYQYSLSWLDVSDVMLVLPGYTTSNGTLKEIKHAEAKGIPVFYSEEELIAWSQRVGNTVKGKMRVNPDCDTCHGLGDIKIWCGVPPAGRMEIVPCRACFPSGTGAEPSAVLCPYCKNPNFVPEVVYRYTEVHGARTSNFKCIHCDNVVKAYFDREVNIFDPMKTDAESDW